MNYLPELRRSLVLAAERRHAHETGSRGRMRAGARAVPVAATVVVAIAIGIGIVALTTLGRVPRNPAGPPSGNPLPRPPAAAFEPHLSRRQRNYIDAANRSTAAHDPACEGTHGPTFTTGRPSPALSSRFQILRQPPTRPNKLPALLHHNLPPERVRGGTIAYNQELYLNQIRVARTAFGATFYVIPAGNASGQRGVPVRCARERAAALEHRLASLSGRQRAKIVAAEKRYAAYLRYLAVHPEGICAAYFPSRVRKLDLSHDLPTCSTLANVEHWGLAFNANAPLGKGVFWTVVPDGVAEVTLNFREPKHATTTVRPTNNLVIARIPARGISEFPATIVLRAADGSVIRRTVVNPQQMPTICGYGC